jgi:hypothetical protein
MARHSNASLGAPSGPFRADQIRDGDPYELSNGHPIHCMSSGRRHGLGHDAGHLALSSDPATHAAPIDLGLTWGEAKHLRAPDLVVGKFDNEPGWEPGVPPLAVEYADRGQDEKQLQEKIGELLERGIQYIWVVRLSGPLRVEVHQPGKKMQLVEADGELRAPGVLQNAVPVRALVDREAALEVTLRNLLNRMGYASLEDLQAEGEAKGRAEGRAEGEARGRAEGAALGMATSILAVLQARGVEVPAPVRVQILQCSDLARLERWLVRATSASTVAEVLAGDALS